MDTKFKVIVLVPVKGPIEPYYTDLYWKLTKEKIKVSRQFLGFNLETEQFDILFIRTDDIPKISGQRPDFWLSVGPFLKDYGDLYFESFCNDGKLPSIEYLIKLIKAFEKGE